MPEGNCTLVKSSVNPLQPTSTKTCSIRPNLETKWVFSFLLLSLRNAAALYSITDFETCGILAAGVPGRAENGNTCNQFR